MRYSRIVAKKYLDEWLKIYEESESGYVYCTRLPRGAASGFSFSNIKPGKFVYDQKVLEEIREHTTFYLCSGKITKINNEYDTKLIARSARLLERWREVREESSHVHCLITDLAMIRILLLGRTKEEVFKIWKEGRY